VTSPQTIMSRDRFNFLSYLMDDDEDGEEDDSLLVMILASVPLEKKRASFYVRNRLEWDSHVAQLEQEGPYACLAMYRMDLQSFTKLCSLVDPFVSVDPVMSEIRTGKGPITTEIALHCLLRWLGGGSYLDIRLCAGISITAFYNSVYRCIAAILHCEQLRYSLPATADEIEEAESAFKAHSTGGVIDGCVACVDWLLLRIQTPSPDETGNVKAYFSGHYQAYGINVQAACDAQCRFVFAALAAPGGANDITAFRKTALHTYIQNLPLGKYIIGDNAYVCSEHLLTPFCGDEKREKQKDAFNFYLSQLRIRVEMTFGRLVNKWRIFKRPMQVKLKNVGQVFLCATRLHNFCIDERVTKLDTTLDCTDTADSYAYVPSDINAATIPGNSMIRDILVEEIAAMGLSRPAYNVQRNS
jgi:DDE superfamily endonuclease